MFELNQQEASDFLANLGYKNFTIKKIAGDASFRSYYRIFLDDKNLILMFAPPSYEDVKPFIFIDEFLVENDFFAPKIYGKDLEKGFLLLQDFGDDSFNKILQKNIDEEFDLYKNACDVLINLQKISPPKELAVYNHDLLYKEVELFLDWYLKYNKKTINLSEKQLFKDLWYKLFDLLQKDNSCLVLRDYHADNLMKLENNQVGLLDFQDAVIGSKSYDLVSLLEDARRDVSEKNVCRLLDYYISASCEEKEGFLRDYKILSLQRNIKILGIFCRLSIRDSKNQYINLLPRVLKLVKNRVNSKDEFLKDISNFLKIYI